jgi:hypothetical protein
MGRFQRATVLCEFFFKWADPSKVSSRPDLWIEKQKRFVVATREVRMEKLRQYAPPPYSTGGILAVAASTTAAAAAAATCTAGLFVHASMHLLRDPSVSSRPSIQYEE